MHPKEVRHFARQQPFVPFRLLVSDGGSYEVRHPELVMLGKTSVSVGITSNTEEKEYDRLATIDMDHISRIESMPAPVSSTGNGKQ